MSLEFQGVAELSNKNFEEDCGVSAWVCVWAGGREREIQNSSISETFFSSS